jgi:hypothetical protein
MREDKDTSSKWIIAHHGASVLRLGGVSGVQSWRSLQTTLAYTRQNPDGLLEVMLAGEREPLLFLVEVASFPERRVVEQVRRDVEIVDLNHDRLPEVLVLVLHPKGQLQVPAQQERQSRLGWTQQRLGWRVVELWTLTAADLLAANDVGLLPWVPLARIDGPPEPVLQECRRRIDAQAPPAQHANFLGVIQVMMGLRYNEPNLLAIFGGEQAMIESPVLQQMLARGHQTDIQVVLTSRFEIVPADILSTVETIFDRTRLRELLAWAARCPDLEAFRARLTSGPPQETGGQNGDQATPDTAG